jgi:putative SOS response-associated peptidase YedK
MCGRFTNQYTWAELHRLYSLSDQSFPPSNFRPRYNAPPTDALPVVRLKDGRRQLSLIKWGLVPNFAKDAKEGAKLINARAETVADKPAFKGAFRHRRCLVPADGFYEWQKLSPKEKQPYFITLKDKEPFAFAGLYENWIPREGPRLETFTIITCAPNALLSPIHDRMPVILTREAWGAWLGEELLSPDRLKSLLKPFDSARMELWPVDRRVGNVANDDAALIEPAKALVFRSSSTTIGIVRETKILLDRELSAGDSARLLSRGTGVIGQ